MPNAALKALLIFPSVAPPVVVNIPGSVRLGDAEFGSGVVADYLLTSAELDDVLLGSTALDDSARGSIEPEDFVYGSVAISDEES